MFTWILLSAQKIIVWIPLTPSHLELLHLPCSSLCKEEEDQYVLILIHVKREMGTIGINDFQGVGDHKNLEDMMALIA